MSPVTHPRLGPLGTSQGRRAPTTPQKAVTAAMGTASPLYAMAAAAAASAGLRHGRRGAASSPHQGPIGGCHVTRGRAREGLRGACPRGGKHPRVLGGAGPSAALGAPKGEAAALPGTCSGHKVPWEALNGPTCCQIP